jgi:hypothetical protein
MGFFDKLFDEVADGVAGAIRLPEKIVNKVLDDDER